jgi:histidinol dehydrogenase
MMNLIKLSEQQDWKKILQRPFSDKQVLLQSVRAIMDDVKSSGDAAIQKYSRIYDGIELTQAAVQQKDWDSANLVTPELKEAIAIATANIRLFHEKQLQPKAVVETMPGVSCWRKWVGIGRVGLYIPGGTAPLFSTLLMLAIPAQIAGCKEIIVCTPPDREGNIHPAIMYIAAQLGIKSVFKIGGVQAIAAMAYGTETIPQVYKIFGPGNQFVTAAKQLVQQEGIAIDMPAGPSELCILADQTAEPAFLAADLLSQAEHGVDSQVLLITNSETLAANVLEQITLQLEKLARKDIASQVLENSKIILVNEMMEGITLVNEYAPEHLIITCQHQENIAEKIENAGSVFIGNYSPEAAGDYATGTNHVLPTNGFAKSYSGVSIDSFLKKISFQQLSAGGLQTIAGAVITMAEAEGLDAHANAVKIRLQNV